MNPSFRDFQIFSVSEPTKWKSQLKGKNTKGIFITYNVLDTENELQAFLAKILAAAKIDLEQDTLWLPAENIPSFSIAQLSSSNSVKYVLVFGRKPQDFGLNISIKLYQPFLLNNIRFVFADDLSIILKERKAGGKVKSAALWNCLKAVFLQK